MKELSKKDLAFEKERIKFRQEKKTLLKEISDKDKEIEGLKTLVRQINNKIEEQNEWIERLLEYCNLNEDDLKQLIGDAEATLIYCLGDQLLQNKMCTISCNPSQLLMITYIGRRGNIPEQVFISDEDWIV